MGCNTDKKKRRLGSPSGIRSRKRERKKLSCYARTWILRRQAQGHYDSKELMDEDIPAFKYYTRFTLNSYEDIFERIRSKLQKKTTNFKEPISPGQRFAATLRYLAIQVTLTTIWSTISEFHITQSVELFLKHAKPYMKVTLLEDFLPCPTTPEKWNKVARGFCDRWNLANCIGAVDGKHVRMRAPRKSGSAFFNYKGFYSIVLLAWKTSCGECFWHTGTQVQVPPDNDAVRT